MYSPIKDGINKHSKLVKFSELKPPTELKDIVHGYWELKTQQRLHEDFILHVIPDACVNILLNLLEPNIAAITMRKTEYVALNLGKFFHYSGVQFLPGMWNGNLNEIRFGFVDSPYNGNLPLIETAKKLANLEFKDFAPVYTDLIHVLISKDIVRKNEIVERILVDIREIETVEEMAASANLSPRQLQRKLKQSTGFSPHDLLKILRLQQSFKGHYLDHFVDQSHFIHSFRKITGYTPKEFFRRFDV
jgi:AraC-like DNA-binding protein